MADTFRILVTGSRDWDAEGTLRQMLINAVATCPDGTGPVIVHGACPTGADAMADTWARDYGFPAEPHPANWRPGGVFDRAAGFKRNAEMVSLGAGLCLAFIRNGSRGATHCAGLAENAGIETRRFTSA